MTDRVPAPVLWLSLIMLVCWCGFHWLSYRSDSRWVNYPTEVTEDNAQTLYRAGEQMMVWPNVGIVVLYASVAASIIEGMDVLLFVIPGAVLLLVGVVAGFVKMFRA